MSYKREEINQINHREFHYIDAMPGSGKTQYFVNHAVKLLTQGGTHILVYVAPTAQLLVETLRRVRKVVGSELTDKILLVASEINLDSALKGLSHPLIKDQPVTALNYLFGLISEEQYKKTRYKRGFTHSLSGPVRAGQIVMTTHESFVRLNRLDLTDRDFYLMQRMTVIFDEARGCVLSPVVFHIPKGEWQRLWQSISVSTITSEERSYRKSEGLPEIKLEKGDKPYHLFEIKDMKKSSEIQEIFEVPGPSLLPKYIKDLRAMFNEYRHGRGSIYIMCNAQLSDLYNPRPNVEKIVVQIVMRPTSLFDNYKNVILTSAFFADSQMYHFLKKDGHTLKSLLDRPKLSPSLKAIKERSDKLKASAVNRLHVATLLHRERGPGTMNAYAQNLTTHLLQNGMVIPYSLRLEASGTLDKNMTHEELLVNLADPKGRPVSTDKEIDLALRSYAVPPLWILLSEATKIFVKWSKKYLEPGSRALLALNAAQEYDRRYWGPTNVRFLYVTRYIMTHGIMMKKPGYSDSDNYKAAHKLDASRTPKVWRQRLKEILYDRSETSSFTVPETSYLHGINRYSDKRAFVHLAALNPSPDMLRFYGILLPEYNIDQDHSIENLVQTLYRTNLRDPEATGPVLMIVPYASSAELLASKIGVKEFKSLDNGRTPLGVLHHFKEMDEEGRNNQRNSVSSALRKYDPSMQKELRAAQRRVMACRSRLRANPTSIRLKLSLEKVEKEFYEIQQKALLKKTCAI